MTRVLNLFCIHFSPGCKKKRRYIIYYAIALLTEHVDLQTPLHNSTGVIEKIKKKINLIYRQIKRNEVAPATDYLFNNVHTDNNLKKTIHKLEKMGEMNYILHRK